MKTLFLFLAQALILPSLSIAQSKTDTVKIDTIKNYQLKEVVVISKTPAVEVLTDKVSLNVGSMPGTTGLNLLEVLRASPGVTVDGQDNVRMTGKSGIQILIDGRLQVVSGQQLASLLKATPANNVRIIELIPNPSAKYDAAGNAGIINIILKKSLNNGTSASVSGGYQFTEHFRQNASGYLNSKLAKLLLFANGSFDNSLQHTRVSSTRILANKTFTQIGNERQGYSNPNMRAGFEYNFSERLKLGSIFSFQHEWEDFPSDAQTLIQGSVPGQLNTSTLASSTQDRITANVNFEYRDTLNSTLTAEADWTGFKSLIDNQVANLFANGQSGSFTNNTKTQISLYSFKTDYTHKQKNSLIEAGLKASASKSENILQTGQSESGLAIIAASSPFDYNEQIFAAYVSSRLQTGKWSLQGGLRAERTGMNGIIAQSTGKLRPFRDTTYLNLFPTVFVRYTINNKHSAGFNYSRRIDRPSFGDQNPYTYRTDFYYSREGNPFLLPQFTNSISADLAINNQTQLKLSYSMTRSVIENITSQNADQTLAVPVNAGQRRLLNLSISSPFAISEIWNGYISIEPGYQFYNADLSAYPGLTDVKTRGSALNAYLSNTFTLGKTLRAGISGWFNYSGRNGIYRNAAIYSIDPSARKSWNNGKYTLSIAYRDLLNSQKWQQQALSASINQLNVRKWESSGAYIGLTYTAGNSKIRNNSSEKGKTDEQGRIKGR